MKIQFQTPKTKHYYPHHNRNSSSTTTHTSKLSYQRDSFSKSSAAQELLDALNKYTPSNPDPQHPWCIFHLPHTPQQHESTKQPVWPSRPIHIFVPLDQRVCAHLRRLIIGSAAHSNAKVSRRAHTSHLPEFIRHIKPERNESTRIFAVSNQSPHISSEFGRLRCKLFVAAVQSIEYWNHHIGLWKQYPHNTYLPFVCVVAVVADVAFVCLVLCVGWRDHRRAVL